MYGWLWEDFEYAGINDEPKAGWRTIPRNDG